MKKILFASTALVAASFAATAYASEPLKASVGGYLNVGIGYQDNNTDEIGVLKEGEIHFKITGTSDNGLTFTGRVELEAFTAGDQIDEYYVKVAGSFGEIMIGSNDTGVDDNHERGVFYSPSAWVGYFDDELSPLYSDNGGDVASIRYTTPTFSGFSASVDWAPEADPGLADGGSDDRFQFGNQQRYSIGASWDGEFNGLTVGIGAGYVFRDFAVGDYGSYSIGGVIGYQGFSFGVHYDSSGNQSVEDAGAIAVGLQYETGPWTFAGGVAFSIEDAGDPAVGGLGDRTTWGIWATYALAPGVSATLGYTGDDEDVDTNGYETTVIGYLNLSF